MIIRSAEFIISAVKPEQYPEGSQPEVALAGRSNVGKSSLINKLINRKNLARTSSRPGKTQTLNYYYINEQFYFVDLPGYGFAQVAKTIKEQWGKFIERYLSKREPLKAVIQLVDIRHAPSKEDIGMFEWLEHFNIPRIVVATKADKISRGQYQKHLKVIKTAMNIPKDVPVVLFSSETGLGKDELWQLLEPYITPEEEPEADASADDTDVETNEVQ